MTFHVTRAFRFLNLVESHANQDRMQNVTIEALLLWGQSSLIHSDLIITFMGGVMRLTMRVYLASVGVFLSSTSALAGTPLPAVDCASALFQTQFNFSGGLQTFTIPNDINSSIYIEAKGAQAGTGGGIVGGLGGLGGFVSGLYQIEAINGGEVLNVVVGGQGVGSTGGFNGGGSGGNINAGGGGGASDVRAGGFEQSNRILVAPGGGGGGTAGCVLLHMGGAGAAGGVVQGDKGVDSPTGGGGFGGGFSNVVGGSGPAGIGCGGFLGSPGLTALTGNGANGGNGQGCCCATTPGGGGGGGGHVGGGGGGGGSAGTVGCSGNDKGGGGGGGGGTFGTTGVINPVTQAGVNTGNGSIKICWGQRPDALYLNGFE